MEDKNKFRTINLENDSSDGSVADIDENDDNNTRANKKKTLKKKKIFFRSDFTGEKESSSSSDEDNVREGPAVNPADLTWPMWLWYYMTFVSQKTFHAAEFCGEKLADFFGITTPKYQYAINEYHRLKQEADEEEEEEEKEGLHHQQIA